MRLSGAVVAAVLAFANPAHADEATARSLYDDGAKAYAEGDYQSACPKFSASYDAGRQPSPLFMQAKCEWKLGRFATASTHLREVLAHRDLEPRLRSEASKLVAELEPQIPRLSVRRAGAPAEASVKLDGVVIAIDTAPTALDPGAHSLEMSCPGHVPVKLEIELATGQREIVDFALGAPLPKPAQAPPEPVGESTATPFWIGFGVGAGVGLAGFATASVTGGLIMAACDGSLGCEQRSASDPSDALLGANYAGWAVGVVGVGTAAVMLALAVTSAPRTVALRPGPVPLGSAIELAF